MLTPMPIRTLRLALLASVLSLVVVLGAGTAGAGVQRAASAAQARREHWSVSLTSSDRTLYQVGQAGQRTYGWNRLVGTTTIDGAAAQVELLGSVRYRTGSGPFSGFITLKLADGSLLGLSVTGRSSASPDGTDASFRATLTVIGGTGAEVGTTGHGTFTGSRKAALGGRVDLDVTLVLRG
jgi:hypothetical protein